jgi:hypothetical protein
VTIPPTFYATYLVGTWILGIHPTVDEIHLSWDWLESVLHEIWQPLLVGSLFCGIVLGGISFFAMRLFWRWHVMKRYRERQAERRRPADSTAKIGPQASRPSTK